MQVVKPSNGINEYFFTNAMMLMQKQLIQNIMVDMLSVCLAVNAASRLFCIMAGFVLSSPATAALDSASVK